MLGLTLALVRLLGYSAMVGAVGGRLGDLGTRCGYQRFMPEVMAFAEATFEGSVLPAWQGRDGPGVVDLPGGPHSFRRNPND